MKAKKAQVKVVYKPVVRKNAGESAADVEQASSAAKPRDPFRRAANEDDDGYDPYSDRPADPAPLFEHDPWT